MHMTNLVLTRKAGQAVRFKADGWEDYIDILDVCGGFCKMRIRSTQQVEKVRFRDSFQISTNVSVCVVDLAKGHAKLNFTAPRDVQILRTELIKEEI
jgi:sRNA-binding carbon storage regulator CsrA